MVQVFCDTFTTSSFKNVPGTTFVAVLVLMMALYLLFSFVAFAIARIPGLSFSRPDSVSVVMCGSTKSAALGIPLIKVIFANDPNIGIVTIPLLMYHAEQLLAGSIMVLYLGKWVEAKGASDLQDEESSPDTVDHNADHIIQVENS